MKILLPVSIFYWDLLPLLKLLLSGWVTVQYEDCLCLRGCTGWKSRTLSGDLRCWAGIPAAPILADPRPPWSRHTSFPPLVSLLSPLWAWLLTFPLCHGDFLPHPPTQGPHFLWPSTPSRSISWISGAHTGDGPAPSSSSLRETCPAILTSSYLLWKQDSCVLLEGVLLQVLLQHPVTPEGEWGAQGIILPLGFTATKLEAPGPVLCGSTSISFLVGTMSSLLPLPSSGFSPSCPAGSRPKGPAMKSIFNSVQSSVCEKRAWVTLQDHLLQGWLFYSSPFSPLPWSVHVSRHHVTTGVLLLWGLGLDALSFLLPMGESIMPQSLLIL